MTFAQAPRRLDSRSAGGRTSAFTPGLRPDGAELPFSADALAEAYGTPLFVYDLDAIAGRARTLRSVLPARVELAFAMKANPSLAVVARLVHEDVALDVASGGELATAIRAGAPARTIVFTGPGKRDDELAVAVNAGIRAITVESPRELDRVECLAAGTGIRASVMLRAALPGPKEGRRIIGGPGARKFGMGPEDLRRSARHASRSRHLELVGLHAFGASNVRDAATLAAHAERTVSVARDIARSIAVPLRLIDVGGGLGIPYGDEEQPLDIVDFGRRLATIADGLARDEWLADARLLLEPGRYLVGPAGWYVTRVVDAKRSGSVPIAIVDGGIHHLASAALVGRRHRITAVPRRSPAGRAASDDDSRGSPPADGARPAGRVLVAGPLCTGLDVLDPAARIAPPAPGDLLVVADVGAYGFTESMPLFLSHPIPAEVALVGGVAHLIRPRREPSAFLDEQRAIAFD